MSNLRVLFATSEVFPLTKTGGLGDVSHALPNALRQIGVDVRLLVPGYSEILEQLSLSVEYEHLMLFPNLEMVRILVGTIPDGNIPIYVIDCPRLFVREGGPYQDKNGKDWQDNALRFGVLSKVAALFGMKHFSFQPEVIHCNDWQTGLAPTYLTYSPAPHAQTVMSIHNIAYQGIFSPDTMNVLELPPQSFNISGLEYNGHVSFLKAGIYYSNWVTTVSPNYAREIQTPEYGYGLHGLLTHRRHQLTGILNGINTHAWNPATDPYLHHPYTIDNLIEKSNNTRTLRAQLGLRASRQRPLLGVVTRLTYQKGIDLLIPIIPEIIKEGGQLAILGSGDKELQNRLLDLVNQYPGDISVTLGYNEALAHQIEAGSDIFLMPSRFEPCGLNQMYSMRYGTIPIVRATGGLADTVVDTTPYNLDEQLATGFVFKHENSEALLHCIRRAMVTFRDKITWYMLQVNGMNCDFSWHHSAQQYLTLYRKLLGG
jgi:starch synthase